jgi:hypothetical protein
MTSKSPSEKSEMFQRESSFCKVCIFFNWSSIGFVIGVSGSKFFGLLIHCIVISQRFTHNFLLIITFTEIHCPLVLKKHFSRMIRHETKQHKNKWTPWQFWKNKNKAYNQNQRRSIAMKMVCNSISLKAKFPDPLNLKLNLIRVSVLVFARIIFLKRYLYSRKIENSKLDMKWIHLQGSSKGIQDPQEILQGWNLQSIDSSSTIEVHDQKQIVFIFHRRPVHRFFLDLRGNIVQDGIFKNREGGDLKWWAFMRTLEHQSRAFLCIFELLSHELFLDQWSPIRWHSLFSSKQSASSFRYRCFSIPSVKKNREALDIKIQIIRV